MLKAQFEFEGVEHDFDHQALAEHDFVRQGHEILVYVSADTSDQLQTTLPAFLEQFFADIAFVGKSLAREVPCHIIRHDAVGGVARGDLQRRDLTFVIDDKCSLSRKNHLMLVLPRGARPSKTL